MQKLDLKKLKQIELDIFKHFIEVCQKLDLNYYVIGGTLLGAVRHKGFIPWDDDIDVGMPRKDYEVFLQKAQELLPSHYFLQTYKTDREFPYPFAKIRDKRTIFKEHLLSKLKINHGVWIDVFPLDYCPRNYGWLIFLQKIIFKRTSCRFIFKKNFIQKISQMFSYIICPSWKKSVELHDKLLKSEIRIFPSFKKAEISREKSMKHYRSDTGYIANLTGRYGCKEIVPSSWFKEPAWLEFEGLKVAGPSQYHQYLTHVYGDYMSLPPKEKQVGDHRFIEFNLNINDGEK